MSEAFWNKSCLFMVDLRGSLKNRRIRLKLYSMSMRYFSDFIDIPLLLYLNLKFRSALKNILKNTL